jgi:hypothetical protein
LYEDQRVAAGFGVGSTLAKAFMKGELGRELLARVYAKTLPVVAGKGGGVQGTKVDGG